MSYYLPTQCHKNKLKFAHLKYASYTEATAGPCTHCSVREIFKFRPPRTIYSATTVTHSASSASHLYRNCCHRGQESRPYTWQQNDSCGIAATSDVCAASNTLQKSPSTQADHFSFKLSLNTCSFSQFRYISTKQHNPNPCCSSVTNAITTCESDLCKILSLLQLMVY